jgi:hypothetical protein
MLSVLSTPCTKPTRCHSATRRPVRRATSASRAAYLLPLPPAEQVCVCVLGGGVQQWHADNASKQTRAKSLRQREEAWPLHGRPKRAAEGRHRSTQRPAAAASAAPPTLQVWVVVLDDVVGQHPRQARLVGAAAHTQTGR